MIKMEWIIEEPGKRENRGIIAQEGAERISEPKAVSK